ncbi:MAG: glycosyltransferase [Candidatus Levybacteria bacterium]|nr:glycosyltransferase [Candidatus Levybacteria bacterium]
MRVLIVSSLKRRIAPDEFASRSRIIYEVAHGLVERGHDVSVLGTGDSIVEGATIIPVIPKGWTSLPPVENDFIRDIAFLTMQAKHIVALQENFDVVHNHTYPDFFPHIVDTQLKIPLLSTLHALYDDYMDETLSLFHNSSFVALSHAYTQLYKKTKFAGVVYNGVDTKTYAYKEEKGDYLFWLGRLPKAKNADGTFMDPKGVRHAIALAQKTGSNLMLGGVVEDPAFFEQDVKPHLNEQIQWVGDVSPKQSLSTEKVVSLMQDAKVFLMTINQEEPFGLVMAEAMSCGTPVIGFDRGSVREVVAEGETGFVVAPEKDIDGLAEALAKIESIKAFDCRKRVEDHFSIAKMVEGYEALYTELIQKK